MRRFVPTLGVTLALAACGADKAPSARSGGKIEKPRAGGANVAENSGDDPGAAGDSDADATAAQDEGELPPYLLSLADAKAIKTLVLTYERPVQEEVPVPASSEYGPLDVFVESFFASNLEKEVFRPGRTFAVVIAKDPTVNAFSTDRQRIIINEGAAARLAAHEMLALLCHEVAHSARNHANVLARAYLKKAVVAASDVANAYMTSHWDEPTQTYTHDAAAYQAALKQWNAAAPLITADSKRLEAEADVYGGLICAEWGVSAADYARGLKGFFARADEEAAAAGQSVAAADLKDGEAFQTDADLLGYYLFPVDTHPTNEERAAQLTRVAPALDARRDATSKAAAEWKRGYPRAGGIALTGDKAIRTSLGRTVRVSRPKP